MVPGEGQKRISTGSSDKAEADLKAALIYAEAMNRVKSGLPSVASTFEAVATDFIERMKKDAARRGITEKQIHHKIAIVKSWLIPFFRGRKIDHIRQADIEAYFDQRRTYWTEGPGKDIIEHNYVRDGKPLVIPITDKMRKNRSEGTLRSDALVLNKLFNFAVSEGLVPGHKKPAIHLRTPRPNPRPDFTTDEFLKLFKEARRQRRIKHPRHRASRTKLLAFILIAGYTGMRVSDIENLNWGDVHGFRALVEGNGNGYDVFIHVHKSKNNTRDVVPQLMAIVGFRLLWDLWKEQQGSSPRDQDPILFDTKGSARDIRAEGWKTS